MTGHLNSLSSLSWASFQQTILPAIDQKLQVSAIFAGAAVVGGSLAFALSFFEKEGQPSIVNRLARVEAAIFSGMSATYALAYLVTSKQIALLALAIFPLLAVVAYRVGYYFYHNANAPIDGVGKRVNLLGHWSEGEFKGGQLHGKGKYETAGGWFIFNEGRVFEGTFENGWLVEGKITESPSAAAPVHKICEGKFYHLHLTDGTYQAWPKKLYGLFGPETESPIYKGKFNDDHELISGTVTYHDGKLEEGSFVDKKLHGKGKRTYPGPGGKVEEGTFDHGTFMG